MSESSPEQKSPAEPVVQPGQQVKVPVEAIAKEREQKRAARAEAEELKRQLAEVKEQNPAFDQDAFVEAVSLTLDQRLEDAIQKAVAPLKADVERRKTAMTLGLNEKQAEAVFQLKDKAPGLSEQELVSLARIQNPDLFPVASRFQRPVTSLPVGGDSPLRSAPAQPDYMALSQKARAEKDTTGMVNNATSSFIQKLNAARIRKNGGGI